MSKKVEDLLGTKGSRSKSSKAKQVQSALVDDEITYTPGRTNNYKVSRALANTFKNLSWVSWGLTGLSGFSALVSLGSENALGINFGLYFGILLAILGVLFAFIFSFLSESINMMLDIEANSRQAAKTLEKILRSQ